MKKKLPADGRDRNRSGTLPISNMLLSSGACPVPSYLEHGLTRIGLGVDGAANSNSSNMLEEIRCAYLLNRLTWGDKAGNTG